MKKEYTAYELFRLAVHSVPFDTFNPHNYEVWKALNICKDHMMRMEKELEAEKRKTARLVGGS